MTSVIDRYLPAIEDELKRSIRPFHKEADGLYRMIRYFLGWEDEIGNPIKIKAGKRYRPILCLLVSQALSRKWRHALPAASAIELFHNFTLILDDIQDHDQYRRGRKTVWAIWGMEQGINAGIVLYGFCAQAALRSPKSLEVIKVLSNASTKIIEGQYLDLSFLKREAITMEEYLTMLKAKTAVLVGAAAELGALLATDDDRLRRIWKEFGESFGLAYQLYDDYQGVWGVTEKTGKVSSGDVREGKKTLPFIVGLARLPQKEAARLATLYQKKERSEAEIREAIKLMEHVDADVETKRWATKTKTTAIQQLAKGGLTRPFLNQFEDLVGLLIPW